MLFVAFPLFGLGEGKDGFPLFYLEHTSHRKETGSEYVHSFMNVIICN